MRRLNPRIEVEVDDAISGSWFVSLELHPCCIGFTIMLYGFSKWLFFEFNLLESKHARRED